jgi:hypothetical protein
MLRVPDAGANIRPHTSADAAPERRAHLGANASIVLTQRLLF